MTRAYVDGWFTRDTGGQGQVFFGIKPISGSYPDPCDLSQSHMIWYQDCPVFETRDFVTRRIFRTAVFPEISQTAEPVPVRLTLEPPQPDTMQNVTEETVKELVDVLENIIIFGLSKDYLLRAKAVIAEVRGEEE